MAGGDVMAMQDKVADALRSQGGVPIRGASETKQGDPHFINKEHNDEAVNDG